MKVAHKPPEAKPFEILHEIAIIENVMEKSTAEVVNKQGKKRETRKQRERHLVVPGSGDEEVRFGTETETGDRVSGRLIHLQILRTNDEKMALQKLLQPKRG